MGRQAHVTRLALGRSPFEEPLRDENGDFILGPNAHINDASGYRQEFDNRGHPQNRASEAAARKFRKAQNDVLATVGVVVRKGEERKSKWERMEDNEKWDMIYKENQLGSQLKAEDRISGVILPWYVVSIRRRLLTFQQYSALPITDIARKEYHIIGSVRLFLAGLPLYLVSSLPQLFRYYICDPNVEGIVNFINPWTDKEFAEAVPAAIRWHSATTLMRFIELPFLVHATLQTLQIIPAEIGLNWRSCIPFTAMSPIYFPTIPSSVSYRNIIHFAKNSLRTPFVLYLIRDYLSVQLGYRFYAIFRQLLTKPDRPDVISAKVSDENETIEDTSIAGIGFPWPGNDREYANHKRFYGPKSFFGALRIAFPPVYHLLNILSGRRIARSNGNLTPDLVKDLKFWIVARYWTQRNSKADQPKRGSPEDLAVRQTTVGDVFRLLNLNPVEELVDPVAWTNDMLGPKADVRRFQALLQQDSNGRWNGLSHSANAQHQLANTHQYDEAVSNILAEAMQAMPLSDVIIIQASDGQVMILAHQPSDGPRNIEEMENIHTIDAAGVPLDAFINGARSMNQESQQGHTAESEPLLDPDLDQIPSLPPTPSPGISRALSLSDPQIQTHSHPSLRTLRRPTETDDSLATISQTLRTEAEAEAHAHVLQSPRPSQRDDFSPIREGFEVEVRTSGVDVPPLTPRMHRQYRVTMLSNYAADSLAWHASAVLTSFVLWPFEAVWLRSVADWAVRNTAVSDVVDPWWAARLGFGVIGRPIDVLSLGTWFGGSSVTSGRSRYVGSILLSLGMEALVRGTCWALGVLYVKRRKDVYGWGRF